MVDMAMVGQYQGPDGTAALAVVAPVWNVIYSLGLLMGIGGSVLFSMRRGGGDSRGSENQFFTAAFIGSVILAAVAWAGMILFEKPILLFFGADALAVYGPVINVSTFVQCCAYSVGQAAQPILSTNFGAWQSGRIRETLRLALGTTAVFGAFWTALSLACPNLYITSAYLWMPRRRFSRSRPASSTRTRFPFCCCRSISSLPIIFRQFCSRGYRSLYLWNAVSW